MKQRAKLLLRIREDEEASYKQVVNYLIGGGLYFISGYITFFLFYHSFHWTLLPSTILSNIMNANFSSLGVDQREIIALNLLMKLGCYDGLNKVWLKLEVGRTKGVQRRGRPTANLKRKRSRGMLFIKIK